MPDRVGQQLGTYRLVRLLGQGGFADVYLGEHLHLGTEAAIKVLHTHLVSEDWESFRKEAQIIAGLVHPHIVRLLDFDVKEGTPFLVMAYAPNGTLRRRHARGVPVPVATVAPYVCQVASALQYVHERKLIHRDVKPENLLVGAEQELLLSDFGVAIMAQSSRHTNMLSIGGTVAYMAPEQVQSKPCAASDQYALGVVVYEWLAGERPFDGSFAEIATKHILTPPPLLRLRVPTLSSGIEAVVLRALEKDPDQRFPSVQAFAQAFEEAAGVAGGIPAGAGQPLPADAAQTLPAGAMQMPPAGAESILAGAEGHLPERGDSLSTHVQVSLLAPEQEGPDALPSTTPVDPSAQTVFAAPTEPEHMGRSISSRLAHGQLSRRAVLGGLVGLAAVSSGLGWLALARRSSPPRAQVTPTLTPSPTPLPGTQLFIYRGHSSKVYAVAWSHDGTRIASAAGASDPKLDVDHTVQVWEAGTGKLLLTYRGHTQAITGLAWSPDSKLMASASSDGTAQVWDAISGVKPLVTYRGHLDHVWDVAFSSDGRSVASCGADATVQVWDAATGKLAYTYRQHKDGVSSVQWAPRGTHILSGSYDNTVQIWEAFTGTLERVYTGHKDRVKSAVWSPDGTRVASGGGNNDFFKDKDHSVQVWDVATGTTLLTYVGHVLPVFAVIWSPDGTRIASAGGDYNVRIWKAASGQNSFIYGDNNLVESLSWSPDGTRIVSGSDDKTAQVWWAG
jgi:WD40 repeat protein/serine/threonine protein kinase